MGFAGLVMAESSKVIHVRNVGHEISEVKKPNLFSLFQFSVSDKRERDYILIFLFNRMTCFSFSNHLVS